PTRTLVGTPDRDISVSLPRMRCPGCGRRWTLAMSNEGDAFSTNEVDDCRVGQNRHLRGSFPMESCPNQIKSGVRISRMGHQFRDALSHPLQQPADIVFREHAREDATEKSRSRSQLVPLEEKPVPPSPGCEHDVLHCLTARTRSARVPGD